MAGKMSEGNTLGRLNDMLFAELERLGSADLGGDELKAEIERARAVSGLAASITDNAGLVLRTVQMQAEVRGSHVPTPKMLEG